MSAKEVWFRRGDGAEFSAIEGSVAFDMMSKDGSFLSIDGPGGSGLVPDEKAENKPEDLSKLTVKQLQEKAALLDVPITKEMKKAEIIAAIEEKVKVPAEE